MTGLGAAFGQLRDRYAPLIRPVQNSHKGLWGHLRDLLDTQAKFQPMRHDYWRVYPIQNSRLGYRVTAKIGGCSC